MRVDFLIYNCFGKKIAEKNNFYFDTKELAECFAEGLIIGISHGKKRMCGLVCFPVGNRNIPELIFKKDLSSKMIEGIISEYSA